MKIVDTTTYFEEKLMMEIRFNILDPYVDKFIVCESRFSHSGRKKKINFDINCYPKFKKKILHYIVENEPTNLIKKKKLSLEEKRFNSIFRINHQRNSIAKLLNQFSKEDFIMHSDNDEIPNLQFLNLKNLDNKYLIFNQKMFYYKFNLMLPSLKWFGTKGCKLKYLSSIENLRNLKNKIYPFYRVDTFFSKIKKMNVKIIENGGWHFSNLKDPEELERKYLNDENHSEYESLGYSKNRIIDNINNRVIDYAHSEKKNSSKRFNQTRLKIENTKILPKYLIDNLNKYKKWIEIDE
jgi:beta-1,4-mannosyl-glycoprotein beta-1,4-N-acetylglucosaminyltransferase